MTDYFTATREEADWENMNPYLTDIRTCSQCGLSRVPFNGCYPCPGYFNTVPPLDVLFIGMSPGGDEDVAGRPFVGRAGKLLFHLYNQVFDTDAWGVSNVVRCHTPENRPPKVMEVAACRPWLEAEVEIASPKVIFLLGNSAIPLAFGKSKIGQVDGTGRVLDTAWYSGVMVACYHPAAALRNNALVPRILSALRLGKELL